jgi:hypothetical protein
LPAGSAKNAVIQKSSIFLDDGLAGENDYDIAVKSNREVNDQLQTLCFFNCSQQMSLRKSRYDGTQIIIHI